MGQQHSLPGKGVGIPSLVTSATDNAPDNSLLFSANQTAGQDHVASSNPPLAVNASSVGGGVEQAQSVRAAIDSFIETCLAGSEEGPNSPKPAPCRRMPASVEVITVPDEDESDGVSVDGGDKAQCSGNGAGKDKNDVLTCEGQQTKDVGCTDNSGDCVPEKKTDSVCVSEGGASVGEKLDRESSPPSLSVSAQNKDQASDAGEVKEESSSKPSQTANGTSEKAGSGASHREGNTSSHIVEGSHCSLEGMESMRLKTIIDRMLDNSLGGGTETSAAPSEQSLLPQIMAEERGDSATSVPQQSDKSRNGEGGASAGAGDPDRRVEPMAICFMEHIEKAVERSFSSITEEEERKEKEKAQTGQTTSKAAENKNSTWSGRASKPSETVSSASSGGDGTISVQDIVDRVINQTEVVAKQPLPSQPSSDSKPTVSASGTFYPDKATVDFSHPSQQQRKEVHKEEMPRESVGRRGRPRMRSPCPERREAVPAPDYLHTPREALRRGPGGSGPGEDYLQSMQAALAKYGTVHPSHRMGPFLPASGPLGKGALPVTTLQNSFMMGGLHASPASFQPRLHGPQHAPMPSQPPPLATPQHAPMPSQPPPLTTPQHAPMPSQPPPLLRVDVMERGELPGHGHPKTPAHAPSRSCMCSACAMYFAREREADRVRMVQQHQQLSPVDRGLPRMPAHPSHPAYSKPMATPSHSHKWPLESRHLDSKQDKSHPYYPYPRGQEVYAAGHAAYGIQTGVPVPQMAYADKQIADVRHMEAHYPKPYEVGEYAVRSAKTETMVRETGPGRHPYPGTMTSGKPPPAPPPSQHPPQASHAAHAVSGGKPDTPLLDLTCRRDTAPSHVEEDKPLDLSSKKTSSSSHGYERQEMRHRRESDPRYDAGDTGVGHGVHGGLSCDQGREGEKYMAASQHLHNLETSVETHFQKLQHVGHRGVPLHNSVSQHNMAASGAPQNFSGGIHPHGTSALVPPQTIGVGRPQVGAGHSNSIPLPPHHPTLPPSHTGSAVGAGHPGYALGLQPVPAYPAEPLLSPGGRRPQLHPIPPPNPSTTLGSAPARSAPAFQSRTGGSSVPGGSAVPLGPGGSSLPLAAGVPAVMSTLPGANSSPMVSLPSSLPRATPPAMPLAVSSPHKSGSAGVNPYMSEYPRLSGSRSVSPPPGNDSRGEDRQRGNSVSKHEPIHSILGNNNPQDILYLICRLCRQTYGSPYGFRKHFRNQHGFEPKAEHALVQTISATKNARQMSGGRTPTLDPESPSQDGHAFPSRTPSMDGLGYPAHPVSPRQDAVRSRPGSASCESMGEVPAGEGVSMAELRRQNSFSRTSSDSKGRSPSGGSLGEEREDTKCLECPECGQTFQLNDFGSYKRHCRQHSQMKGAGREGNGSQAVYSCAECQSSFPESQLLQDHVQRHHTNNGTVTCALCHTSFSSADYQDHMRTAHNASSQEDASPSPPVTVGDRAKVSSASSRCDISSSSSAVKREVPSTSVTNSMTSFNLTVTTPSDLEICRLPADPIVTSASPDSSSDNKKPQDNSGNGKKAQDSSPVSSSEQLKTEVGKTESSSVDSPKSGSSEGMDIVRTATENKDSIKVDTDDKQLMSEENSKCSSASANESFNSSLDADDNADLFMYKHKKFSAHRKRSSSSVSESAASEAKQACVDENGAKAEKTQQNVVSSATEKQQGKTSESKAMTEEVKPKAAASKTEARHPLPFVWDRVTRSQAGKHARSSDFS